ncbi:MAG: phosphate propanoyltransferase [Christensenellaceae bacterium]|jgi:putative phosphotransacetylase|nr:phosphate propanoyltransferase [Christensenellaceae bacterium]
MNKLYAPVGISNRHIHLSKEHVAALFGVGYSLTPKHELYQKGQYAMQECVTLHGPKGHMTGVRVLGPERKQTQVELSRTDCYKLGIKGCIRQSGDLAGTPGLLVIGPAGQVELSEGAMVAARHLHLSNEEALEHGLKDGQWVSAYIPGDRATIFEQVLVRASADFKNELHLDTDEVNAANIESGQEVEIIWK